jgi:polysaccharide pyruvyl transferase WcaK-like protein
MLLWKNRIHEDFESDTIMDSNNKRVVIIGGFGWEDIGDEAMPQAVIFNLRRLMGDLDIVMFSPNPEYTTEYHGERSIRDVNSFFFHEGWLVERLKNTRLWFIAKVLKRLYPRKVSFSMRWLYFLLAAKCLYYKFSLPIDKHAKMVLQELAASKLLFNNGGGNINSLLSGELYKQTATILAASFLGLPVILSGQTIGPIHTKLHALVVKNALNRATIITLRDKDVSRNRLLEISVNRPSMRDTCDDAIGLPVIEQSKVKRLICENGGDKWLEKKTKITAVINMNGYLKAMGKKSLTEFGNEIRLLTTTADRLVKDANAKILFVPTDYGKASDDRPLLNKIRSGMKFQDQALVINMAYDAVQYKSLIGVGDIAIGVRYHFAVFATSMGVPCIALANGVYQKTKLKGVMDLYNVPYCYISKDMSQVDQQELWIVIERVLSDLSRIANHLRERTKALLRESMLPILAARDILENRGV